MITPVNIDSDLRIKCQNAIIERSELCSATTRFEWTEIYSADRRIYLIQPDNTTRPFVLKLRHENPDNPDDLDKNDLQKEFTNLQNAWVTLSNCPPSLTMSEPIRIWTEHYAMLIGYCSGKDLNSLFNSSLPLWLLTPSKLGKSFYQVGEWLGHYHREVDPCEVPVMTDKLKYLQDIMDKIKQHDAGKLPEQYWSQVEARITQSWNRGSNLKAGIIHGNFAFRNIMSSQDHIGLVDFENARVDLLAQDIGQFAAEIIYKCQYPGFGRHRKLWLQQFFNGYHTHCDFSFPELSAQIAYHLLLHRYELSQRKHESPVRKLLSNYRVSYLNKQLKSWLDTADYWLVLK